MSGVTGPEAKAAQDLAAVLEKDVGVLTAQVSGLAAGTAQHDALALEAR